ncbi:MAG: ribonuclease III [Bryobacteraceae bacterium]
MSSVQEELEAKLGYSFRNRDLLERALTHRSRFSELPPASQVGDNEQLEFLGDSILGFVVSEVLVLKHPDAREGHLSKWKAHLVSAAHLHRCALELGLGEFLLLGRGEDMNGGREKKALLSDALEALIAALYIDGGLSTAQKFIEARILHALPDASDSTSLDMLDYKSALQERAQSLGFPPPRYVTVNAEGPEHSKIFTVEAQLGGGMRSRATGLAKKVASQKAARLLLDELNRLEAVEKSTPMPVVSPEA